MATVIDSFRGPVDAYTAVNRAMVRCFPDVRDRDWYWISESDGYFRRKSAGGLLYRVRKDNHEWIIERLSQNEERKYLSIIESRDKFLDSIAKEEEAARPQQADDTMVRIRIPKNNTAFREKRPQLASDKDCDRADHVWVIVPGVPAKCCLCGGIAKTPPAYPTPEDWLPETNETLSDWERALCPHPEKARKAA